MTPLRIEPTDNVAACHAIRHAVFCQEQGVDPALERDEKDSQSLHLLAYSGEVAIGTARIEFVSNRAKIGRVAVLPSHRGQGIGRALVAAALAEIDRRDEIAETILSAQKQATGLYEAFGFEGFAEETIADIPHLWMRRPAHADSAD